MTGSIQYFQFPVNSSQGRLKQVYEYLTRSDPDIASDYTLPMGSKSIAKSERHLFEVFIERLFD